MKKVFLLMAAAMMVMTVACNNKSNGKNNGGNEQEDEVLINIDGKFSDWEALTDVKVAKYNKNFEDEVIGEGELIILDALNNLKAVADKYYLYLYFEINMGKEHPGGVNWEGKPVAKAYAQPVEIYIDADNNGETGCLVWVWDPCGAEYNFEANIGTKEIDPEAELTGSFAKYTGEDGKDLWEGGVYNAEEITQLGLYAGKGALDGDILKYEIRFARAFLPLLQSKIGVAVELMSSEWALMGVLPQAQEEGVWTGKFYEVTLP